MQCKCEKQEMLRGQEAYDYSKQEHMQESGRAPGEWRYLLRCEVCGAYWEMTWEGGGGFDDGIMTLHRLSPAEVKTRWPDIEQ